MNFRAKRYIVFLLVIFIYSGFAYSEEKKIWKKKAKKSLGVVMMKTPLKDWDKIQSLIEPEDVHDPKWKNLRRETWPHITILYGLHDDKVDEVKKVLSELKKPISYKIVDISLFKAKFCDILKFGVVSDEIQALHKKLKIYPNSYKFSGLSPHMTLAFVRKGEGKKYAGKLTTPIELQGIEFVYQQGDKDKRHVIKISVESKTENIVGGKIYEQICTELKINEKKSTSEIKRLLNQDLKVLVDKINVYNSIEHIPLNILDDLKPKYIKKIPVDPWNRPYRTFHIIGYVCSDGPDGKKNTTDDIRVSYLPAFKPVSAMVHYIGKSVKISRGDKICVSLSRPVGKMTFGSVENNFVLYDPVMKLEPSFGKGAYFEYSGINGRVINIVLGDNPRLKPGRSMLQIHMKNCSIFDMSFPLEKRLIRTKEPITIQK